MPDQIWILFPGTRDSRWSQRTKERARCQESKCRGDSKDGFGVFKMVAGPYFPRMFGRLFGVGVCL